MYCIVLFFFFFFQPGFVLEVPGVSKKVCVNISQSESVDSANSYLVKSKNGQSKQIWSIPYWLTTPRELLDKGTLITYL